MTHPQLASRFALLALYALAFTLIWPWVGDGYGRAFRAGSMEMCKAVSSSWAVEMMPIERPTAYTDSVLRLTNRSSRSSAKGPISSRYIGYAPTTLLVALILATPISWRRRLTALFWGLVLMHAWIGFSVILMVVHGYSGGNVISIYDVSPSTRTVLAFLREVLVKAPVIKYTVPAVIWMLVSFRRSDWATVFGPTEAKGSSSTRGKA